MPKHTKYPQVYQDYFDVPGEVSKDQQDLLLKGGGWAHIGNTDRHVYHKNNRKFSPALRDYAADVNLDLTDWLSDYNLTILNPFAMAKNSARYNHFEYDMDWETFQEASNWMHYEFFAHLKNSQELSLGEAIAAANKETSPGSPWMKEYQDKADALNDPEVMEYINEHWEALAQFNYDGSLWNNSLKEEIRPNEKLRQNKIRTFTASALELSINGARLCKDFNDKLTAARLKTASVKGMPKQFGIWDRFLKRCARHPYGRELDGSQFDARMQRSIIFAIYSFRWECLREEDKTPENFVRLWNICQDIVYSKVVFDNGATFMKHLGNPSGSPNTIDDNTLYNFFITVYAVIRRLKRLNMECEGYRAFRNFRNNVGLYLLGDDNNAFWDPSYDNVMDFDSLVQEWAEVGYEVTTPCTSLRTPYECEFLSHSNVYNEESGLWLPLPNVKKLLASLCYQRWKDPGYSLIRAVAIHGEIWPDPYWRRVLRDYIDDLVQRYDCVLQDDEWWQAGMAAQHSDDFYFKLYTGFEGVPSSQPQQ